MPLKHCVNNSFLSAFLRLKRKSLLRFGACSCTLTQKRNNQRTKTPQTKRLSSILRTKRPFCVLVCNTTQKTKHAHTLKKKAQTYFQDDGFAFESRKTFARVCVFQTSKCRCTVAQTPQIAVKQICNKLRKHKNAPVVRVRFFVESVFVAVATAKRNCVLKNTFAKRSFEFVCSPLPDVFVSLPPPANLTGCFCPSDSLWQ